MNRTPNFLARPLPTFLLLSLLAALIYSNTFSASFHFDDTPNIVENPRIKNLSNFFDLSGTRYIGFLSFALNYHFDGLDVFGYHLANLLIHIVNGFLVYWLVSLLLEIPNPQAGVGETQGGAPTPSWIALATALVFIAHPIQTQAVTYIVQRFASLTALFYLLAIVCYLKWRLSPSETRRRHLWYGMALVSTLLAMKTKENSFTLPFMILLIEAVFFRSFTKKTWGSLTPFLLTLSIIPLSHVDAVGEAEAGFAQETTAISRHDYFFTQVRVIITYLRLLVLPIHQNLDYDYPIYHSPFDPPVLFSFMFLSILIAISLYILFSSRPMFFSFRLPAFGILWFFLTLSVESSIIPIRDVIFEHRLYLPSVGFFLSSTIAATRHISRPLFRIISFSLILFVFSEATYHRNWIWKNEVTLWADVVLKSPNKAGGHNNLGLAYAAQKRWEEAKKMYMNASKLDPALADVHNNLGNLYRHQGQLGQAIQEYQTALKLNPDDADAHSNIGTVYIDLSRLDEAIHEFQVALKLRPDYAMAHYNLGNVYIAQGSLEMAIHSYQIALKLQPDFVEAHYNLGIGYYRKRQIDQAIHEFERALKLKPDFLAAQKALESLSR